jgi:hypothetical protein
MTEPFKLDPPPIYDEHYAETQRYEIDFDQMGREVREAFLRGEIVDTGMLDGEEEGKPNE